MQSTITVLAEALSVQFRMNQFIAKKNLDGITHADSLIRAVPGGNNMNWIVGHVVATRCDLLPILGETSIWSDAQKHLYRRGMALVEKPEHLPFEEIVHTFHATQDLLLTGLANTSEEQFAAPAPFSLPGGNPDTVGTMLTKCAIHEGYHLGQTGILRRVIGRPGAIR